VGYDGFKHRKGTKIHVIVDEGSKPIAVHSVRETPTTLRCSTLFTIR
jgi:hypothetical protein